MGVKKLLSEEQENHAVWLAISGEDPRPYLAECGAKNPQVTWNGIRNRVKSEDPETFAKLPKVIGHKKRPNFPMPIPGVPQPHTPTIETPEGVIFNGKQYDPMEPVTAAEAMEGMKAAADEFFSKCEEMGLKLDKEPALTEYALEKKITGLMVEIGDFHYYPRTGYVDWTPVGHTEIVSLNTEEWQQVIRDMPEVLKELGAVK